MRHNDIVRTLIGAWVLVGMLGLISGCNWTQTGRLQEETRTLPLDGAKAVSVDVRMGAGMLEVTGSSDPDVLMDAEFVYNVAAWEPMLDYAVSSSGEGELVIEQPDVKNLSLKSYRNEWALALHEDVPIDLSVKLGAGESDLALGQLSLSALDVRMGVGGMTLDLVGNYEHDVEVSLRGGVGEGTVLLPADVGVIVRVDGGLGELDVSGMTRDGDAYVNEAYGQSETTITVDIQAGVGGLDLEVVE